MADPMDFKSFLDRDVIEKLKRAYPDEIRETLVQHLPEDEVDEVIKRIGELIEAAEEVV